MDGAETLVRNKMLKVWRFLYARGFIQGFGHMSCRLRSCDLFLVSRHSLVPKASSEDLLRCDMEGRNPSGNENAAAC